MNLDKIIILFHEISSFVIGSLKNQDKVYDHILIHYSTQGIIFDNIFQSDTEDPRQINQFCLALHERRKQFLSKNTVPHKLLKSDFEEVYHYVVHRLVLFFPLIN